MKTFDCIEMKRQIQKKLWLEAGENIDGFKRLLFDKENNQLYKLYIQRKEKQDS